MPGPLVSLSPARRGPRGFVAAALAAAVVAGPAFAQAPASGSGFLLGTPVGSISLRGGYDQALAGSDIFRQNFRDLTLSRGSFGGLSLAADLGIRISDRYDFQLGLAMARSSANSESRDWTEQDDSPIQQTTRLTRVPLTAGLKAYLTPRGRSVGRLAWIPSRVSPYVGAGGGVLWHKYEQSGDFAAVAENPTAPPIFSATFTNSRWTPEAHALAGIDYSVSPRLALTTEARYVWARAPMDLATFQGFDRIDLSGVSATAGITVRF